MTMKTAEECLRSLQDVYAARGFITKASIVAIQRDALEAAAKAVDSIIGGTSTPTEMEIQDAIHDLIADLEAKR